MPLLVLDILVVFLVAAVHVAKLVLAGVLHTHLENIIFIQLRALVLEVLEVDEVVFVFGHDFVRRSGHLFFLTPGLIVNAVAELECEVFLIVFLVPHKAIDSETRPSPELESVVAVRTR